MNITVINGSTKKGTTDHLKTLFLEPFQGRANIVEYDLPQDGPDFCTGCTACFLKGETFCKDAAAVQTIETDLRQADLIVMTSPTYVLHTTAAMKNLLDHLGYRFMPHRPAREMFYKRAVILTQCVGSGARSAAKDIRDSLSWWGISVIGVFAQPLMEDIVWDKLPPKRQNKLEHKVRKLSTRFAAIDYSKPAPVKLPVRLKFLFCRMIQKSIRKKDPHATDGNYWAEQGWLGNQRPWKHP